MQYTHIGKYIKTKREELNIGLNEFAFGCGIEHCRLGILAQQHQ